MSVVAQMIARARGPLADRCLGRCPTTRLGRCSWPRTCSGPIAPWRTSAVATRRRRAPTTDHVGRTIEAMWVKGSGIGSRDDAGEGLHAAAPGGDSAAARTRRDVRRGHGRASRALPDRPSGAAFVDRDAAARIHSRCARAPHPSRRHQRPGRDRATASGWSPSASEMRRRGSRTSGRASPSPSRSAWPFATTRR